MTVSQRACALALLLAASTVPVFAHEEVEHATEAEAIAHELETRTQTAATPYVGAGPQTHTFQALVEKYRAQLAKQNPSRVSIARTSWSKGTSIASTTASCVQKAVDTREVALQSAFGKSNASITDALKARQTALYAAWGTAETSARNTALKAAWNTWKTARNTAGKTLKTERDSAWKTFKTTVKDTCKVSVPTEDASAGSDTAGQTAI